MSYFPLFLKIDTLNILLVGGGNIAFEKLEKLLDFSSAITIVALEPNPKLQQLAQKNHLTLHQRAYLRDECLQYDIVIVATNTIELHQQIFKESRGSKTLVNSVDNTNYCDFIFPSYIKENDLTIAFSTNGASPAFAKKIKEHFKTLLPSDVGAFLAKMKMLRSSMPKGKKRMVYFEGLVREYFEKRFKP